MGKWLRLRRATVTASDDPYSAYQEWMRAGRPSLEPVDFLEASAVALPAASDSPPSAEPVAPVVEAATVVEAASVVEAAPVAEPQMADAAAAEAPAGFPSRRSLREGRR